MSDSIITPELQFDVQLRAAALDQAIKTFSSLPNVSSEFITEHAMVFLHFLRTGIPINQGE